MKDYIILYQIKYVLSVSDFQTDVCGFSLVSSLFYRYIHCITKNILSNVLTFYISELVDRFIW